MQQQIRPVTGNESDDGQTIFDDRSTVMNAIVNKDGEVAQPPPLDTMVKANSDGKDLAPLNNMSQPLIGPCKS